MPDVHVLPGIWTPIRGYDVLVDALEKHGYQRDDGPASRATLIAYAYDWRLSNRYNGERLKTVVEPALERLRAQGGAYADAKVVFVCHSMGGPRRALVHREVRRRRGDPQAHHARHPVARCDRRARAARQRRQEGHRPAVRST